MMEEQLDNFLAAVICGINQRGPVVYISHVYVGPSRNQQFGQGPVTGVACHVERGTSVKIYGIYCSPCIDKHFRSISYPPLDAA
jgi:hypothetical protein